VKLAAARGLCWRPVHVGFSDDMRQLGNAWAQMLGKPSLLVRELTLAVRGSAQGYYEALGDDVLETQDGGFRDPNKPLWLNLGYWERARTYPEAAADLARKLGRAARLGKGDTVLDAGFGYGEQDLLWVNEFDVARIIGVNVTALHVDRAKARVAARGLSDRIDLRLGSATEIPLEAGSVDKVVALESAFHFDTREKFFAEAMRVLKPGGRLATADCVPYVGEKPGGFIQRMAWRRWGVPVANVYDREAYRDKLAQHGFTQIEVESIRNHVFPGVQRYAEQRMKGVPIDQAVVELSAADIEQCLGAEGWAREGGLSDYVIFSAVKPS
jgi:microcystin synthetase protein McyJ